MKRIFVFGSNEAGIHGEGAAKEAYERHGAIWGVGLGPQGNSYGIPTKDATVKRRLSLDDIDFNIRCFIEYAKHNWDDEFIVTRIACGYSRYKDEQIAPLFKTAPNNCLFDDLWRDYLPNKRFWGTYRSK